MNKKFILIILIVILITIYNYSIESLNRGLIVIQDDLKSVYIGWRLFKNDPDDIEFILEKIVKNYINEKSILIKKGFFTNYLDNDIYFNNVITYKLTTKSLKNNINTIDIYIIKITDNPKKYLSIPLNGKYTFQKIGIGDLNGDGELEFIIKQPNYNVDPYQKEGYWKKSETTYKIEAYKLDGTLLWDYDMGWSIEAGIWYSPFIVYDLDQDGKSEIYCKASDGNDYRNEKGLVEIGPEYLVKIDGSTGKIIDKTDWIKRESYPDYNYASRNFLAIAYLDGKNPSLIMQRGTYNLIKTYALDKNFNILWKWQSSKNDLIKNLNSWGQGSHGLIASDIDNDKNDELIIGACVIDDNGKGLWSLGMGHPDVCYVADMLLTNPGLEIFYGFETKQSKNGICLVDAKTGKILWGIDTLTTHIHSQGMIGDILSDYDGIEVYAGESDKKNIWLFSSNGKLIKNYIDYSLTPRPLWWDNDNEKEVCYNKYIKKWEGKSYLKIEGEVIAVMDCLGDYREELITSYQGEIRIYSTTILSDKSLPCLLDDHNYRMGIVVQTMGYYYPAQLGYKY